MVPVSLPYVIETFCKYPFVTSLLLFQQGLQNTVSPGGNYDPAPPLPKGCSGYDTKLHLVSLFNDISNFMGYLMLKPCL